MENYSKFRDFIAFLSTIRGDIANITAPPSFLAPLSVVELPSCWTARPSLFIAPTLEPNPEKRSLLVLQWVLVALKAQFYIGQDVSVGMRKPLNAFLGELFLGQWTDEGSTVKVISEQVSHHPPITASHMWDEDHGIRGTGYTRVEMSFTGSLNVKQTGHAMLHLDRFDEDYLIPFPDCKVQGFLSGKLYPELGGTCHIISSSGFVSEITFSGQGLFSGTRNHFTAKMYRAKDITKTPIYLATGQWSSEFTIRNANGETIITCGAKGSPVAALQIPGLDDQDHWESRNAWKNVLAALRKGDMQSTIREKTKLEEAQRKMRKKEWAEGIQWEPKFFSSTTDDPVFSKLAAVTGWKLQAERTKGVWRFDYAKREKAEKPYHGDITPFG